MFSNHISDKGLTYRIHREHFKLKSGKKKFQLENGKRHKETFYQREQIGGKYMYEKMFNLIRF